MIAAHGQVERDRQRLIDNAIVVQIVLEPIGPRRQGRDFLSHQGRCPLGRCIEGFAHDRVAVLAEERMETALAQVQGIQLAIQITPVRPRHARIGVEDVDDVLLEHALAKQLHRRDENALLVAFGGSRIVAARDIAADIEPMSDGRKPGEEPPIPHQRAHQPKIIQMRATLVRVVEDEGVTRLDAGTGRHMIDHGLHCKGHGADENWQPLLTLDERRPRLGMVEAVAGVPRFGNDWIEGRSVQRRVHLVGNLFEAPKKNRERYGIERTHHASPS